MALFLIPLIKMGVWMGAKRNGVPIPFHHCLHILFLFPVSYLMKTLGFLISRRRKKLFSWLLKSKKYVISIETDMVAQNSLMIHVLLDFNSLTLTQVLLLALGEKRGHQSSGTNWVKCHCHHKLLCVGRQWWLHTRCWEKDTLG